MAKITEELKKEFIRLYEEEKMSTTQIGKLYQIDRSTVFYHLKKSEVNTRPVRKINLEDIKNKENTPDFDYFIGILATDGCVSNNTISLEFSEDNSEILTHWNTFLENKCNVNTHLNKKTGITYYKISFMNKEICNYLEKFGITPRKSLNITISYINWDVLRGIFDGDGSLSYDLRHGLSAKFRIASGSIDFLNQIKEFLETFDIKVCIYSDKDSNTSSLIVGILEDIYKIYDNMYKNATYFLNRKYVKFGPLVEKFISKHSVNSGDEEGTSNPEPSFDINIIEGAETRNGEPKLDNI